MLVLGVGFGIWGCGTADPTATDSDGMAGSDGQASGIGGSVDGIGGSMDGIGGTGVGGYQGIGGAGVGGAGVGGSGVGGTGTGGEGTGGDGVGGDWFGVGGEPASGGGPGTGGGATVDCDAPMPAGGTAHCGSNASGTAGGLAWSLWSKNLNSNSCITTYETTAFSAGWVESGDFLARIGLEWGGWGETPQPYTAYGTIMAQFSYSKTGTGGGFSYIGMYGWSNDPCVEYYIVEDSWNTFPFNPWQATQTGSATIDGEEYRFYRNQTNGTGGSRCSGVTTWDQFWSVRQSARQCGTISLTEHFDAWTAAGMQLGNMLEAKILVEVGGGAGSIEFPVANVVAE